MINPLILDYVKSESRGLGMGIVTYGFVFGELLMISIFMQTRDMTMYSQYLVPAIVVSLIAISMFWLIREPTIKKN